MTETIDFFRGMFRYKKHIVEEIGNGKVLDYYIVNGEKDGICITKYKDVIICKAFYMKGKLNGTYETWYETGEKEIQCTYKGGKKDGTYTSWHRNGRMKEQCTYKDGKKEGTYTSWHGHGRMKEQCSYKDGKREGTYTSWYGNGQMYEFEEWADDVDGIRYLKKSSKHNIDGRIQSRSCYDEDGYLIVKRWNEDGTSVEAVWDYAKGIYGHIMEERHYDRFGNIRYTIWNGCYNPSKPITERRQCVRWYNSFGNICEETLRDGATLKPITVKRWYDNGQLAMEFDEKSTRYYDENGNEIDPDVIKAKACQQEEDYRRKREEEEENRKREEEEKKRIRDEEFRRNMPRSFQDTGSVVNWSKSQHPDKSFLAREYGTNVGDVELFNGHRYEIRHYINPYFDHREEWSGSSITPSSIPLRHCNTLNELIEIIQEKDFAYCLEFYKYHRRLPSKWE